MRMRIEELARASGVSARNIRAYQQRGLLPGPTLEGRTGYYGREHADRLRLIEQLQGQGYSLAAIGRTLDAWASGGQLSDLVGFDNVLRAPFAEEAGEPATAEELFARFPEARDDPALVQRSIDLELIEPDADGGFVVPSPMLLQAGQALVDAGVPLARLLDLVEGVQVDVADIADRFVRLVAEDVMQPAVEADDDALVRALRTVEQLRPIALEVIRPFLARALEQRVDRELRSRGLDQLVEDDQVRGVSDTSV